MSNPLALLSRTATYALLTLAAFISVFPFFWMLVGATNSSNDIIRGKATPGTALFENIATFVNSVDLPRILFNSFFIAGVGTIATLIVASLAGYGFEMFRSKAREKVFGVMILGLSIPFAALMIPLFVMMASFKMINTYQAIILPTVASIFIIFYFRQAFFFIYMPVMRSTYAAATIIVFMANWNNYLWPLIVLQTNDMKTLTLVVAGLTSAYTPDFGVVMVGSITATLPTLIIFFLLQRRFVEGMLGAVK